MILPLHNAVRAKFRTVLTKHYGLDESSLPEIVIKYPPNRSLGDLSITVAFELSRTLRKAPKLIGKEIVAALGQIDGVTKAEATPSGYVNLYLNRPAFLKTVIAPAVGKPSPTAAEGKTIVEHTSINPNKAAHIGHMRNAALGDTLVRLLRFQHRLVEVQNYIDDTGVQVADVVVGFRELQQKGLNEITHLANNSRFDYHCWDLYAQVTEWYKADTARLKFRTRALQDLENGDNETSKIAAFIADRIVRCHLATMERLNVDYDLLAWEGDILRLEFWTRAFDVLKKSGAVFHQTKGAQAGCWVMLLDDRPGSTETPDDATREAAPAKVIVRSDGTVTYVGKDIAYQFWKFGLLDKDFHYRLYAHQRSDRPIWATEATATSGSAPPPFGRASAVYNVIDTRQSYLQNLLKQALFAIKHANEAEHSMHFSYEMVALSPATASAFGYDVDTEAGQPFIEVSGRKGLGVKADDLLDRVTDAARQEVVARNKELSDAEADRIAGIIAVAAIRYSMIKYSRGKVIAFDIEEALSFEGESGPYLQYATVRATNILRKFQARDGHDETQLAALLDTLAPTALIDDGDAGATDLWALVLEAARLDEVAGQAVRTLELSLLAKYAFSLAQAFNTFYHRYQVINENRQDVRLWRAAAVSYSRQQLTRALNLMGCEVPPLM